MEVLAGARDDRREADVRRLLPRFQLLSFDPVVDFDGALRIYRRCRAAGVTRRGMIASVALRPPRRDPPRPRRRHGPRRDVTGIAVDEASVRA
jgi:hypothetical protein